MTLVEKWSGRKPIFKHLRTNGCVSRVHILDEVERSWMQNVMKLDAKCNVCMMMGYSKESKAYILFDLVKKVIIIRRNVILMIKS